MRKAEDGIRFISFSSDFKNNAGRKADAFFFAEDLLCFLVLLPPALLILRLMKAGSAAVWTLLLLPAGFCLFTFFRLRLERLWKTILATVLSAAALSALFFAAGNYFATAAILIAAVVSLRKTGKDFSRRYERTVDRDQKFRFPVYRKKIPGSREDADTGSLYFGSPIILFSGILSFIVYLVAVGFGATDLAVFCAFDFAAVFAFMMIYNQKSGEYCLSLWDKKSGPGNAVGGGKADRAGSAFLAFLTVAGTAAVALASYFIAEFSGMSRMDQAFVGALQNFINQKPAEPQKKAPPVISRPPEAMPEQLLKELNQSRKESPAAGAVRAVLTVLMWILLALAAVLIAAAVGSAVLKFLRKLNKNINEDSRSLLPVSRTHGKVKIPFSPRKGRKRLWNLFPHTDSRLAIRRLFFRHVKKHFGRTVRDSETPFEIGRGIRDASDMETAVSLYEKARYSSNDCEKKDVKAMKLALKPALQKVRKGNGMP